MYRTVFWTLGEGEGGMIWGNGIETCMLSSVQFSRSVVSDSLRPHELQHARPPCPSPTPGVNPDSCPSSQWCHSSISSSVVPFSSCPQYPAIKKNAFKSVLMRSMKLEPIIQSEVSQKEKHQYSILTHMNGI